MNTLRIALLVLVGGFAANATAQEVDGRFRAQYWAVEGASPLFDVTLELRADAGSFGLGNSTFMLEYDPEALTLQEDVPGNGFLVQDRDYRIYAPFDFDPENGSHYESTATVFGAPGRVAVNVVLPQGSPGQDVAGEFAAIADLHFVVADPSLEPGLAWVTEGANPTAVFRSDNRSEIVLGTFDGEVAGGVAIEGSELPERITLDPAYPNPFNPTTTLRYALPAASEVALVIYDVIGRRVATLVDGEQHAGWHTVSWQADRYASGLYFARLISQDVVRTQSLILVK